MVAVCEVSRLLTSWQIKKQERRWSPGVRSSFQSLPLDTSFLQVLKLSPASYGTATCWRTMVRTGACGGQFRIRTLSRSPGDMVHTARPSPWFSLLLISFTDHVFEQWIFSMSIFNLMENYRWSFRKFCSVVWAISKREMRRNICQPFKKLFRFSVVLRSPENRSIYIWHLLWLFIVWFTKYAQRAHLPGSDKEMNT